MIRTITYNGKSVKTKYHSALEWQEFHELRAQYYAKPSIEQVQLEILKFHQGSIKTTLITNYYFKALMSKVILHHSKFSIQEVFMCKELLEVFTGKVALNKKVFPESQPLIKNITTAIRLGGKGIASKPTNFPVKVAKQILDKYNVNNNYYDFSCGWGVRMLSALSLGINYYGSDPNTELVEQLNSLEKEYRKVTRVDSLVKLYPKGSEIFIPELENKIGLSFSSPPYFNLEDYRVGEQSYKVGTSYGDWLKNFVEPMLTNLYRYAINNGIIAINVKNFNGNNLYNDIFKMCKELGLVLVEEIVLDIGKRQQHSEEKIMVFKKQKGENENDRTIF